MSGRKRVRWKRWQNDCTSYRGISRTLKNDRRCRVGRGAIFKDTFFDDTKDSENLITLLYR